MEEPVIQLRENGPIIIQLPVKIMDHLGNLFTIQPGKPTVALCRCGQSNRKPFCDGSHKQCGFQASDLAVPQPTNPSAPPAATP